MMKTNPSDLMIWKVIVTTSLAYISIIYSGIILIGAKLSSEQGEASRMKG